MKALYILVCLLPVLFVACTDKPKNPDEKPNNPIAVQGDRMIDAYHRSKDAQIEANLDAIKKAIQAHRAVNDSFPQSLEEIKPLLSAPELDLSKYTYNAADGSVAIKK
ncbi:MAG: hypothetical protein HZB31_05405 [Nitrospirae bacterium]|nr:hypothetical protein [Nitrospirota bacterium]